MTQQTSEIKDLAGNVVGVLQDKRLTVTSKAISQWDMLYIILQAQQECGSAGVESIEFLACISIAVQYPANDSLLELYSSERERFKVRSIKIDNKTLFGFFYTVLAHDKGFDIQNIVRPSNQQNIPMLEKMDLSYSEAPLISYLQDITSCCPNLRELRLERCSYGPFDAAEIGAFISASRIIRLYLKGNEMPETVLGAIAISLYDHSEELLKKDKSFSAASCKAHNDFELEPYIEKIEYAPGMFAQVPRWGGTLDLTNIDLNDGRSNINKNPHLNELHRKLLIGNPDKIVCNYSAARAFDKIFKQRLIYSDSVTSLEISGYEGMLYSSGPMVEKIASVMSACFPNVRKLVADNNDFTGIEAGGYLGARFSLLVTQPGMESVSLRNCHMTDKDIALAGSDCLTANPAAQELLSLNLAGNNLTDACAAPLLEWLENSGIVTLDVTGNKFSQQNLLAFESATAENIRRATANQAQGGAEGRGRQWAQDQSINANELRSKLRRPFVITGIGQ